MRLLDLGTPQVGFASPVDFKLPQLPELHNVKRLSLDTETTGLNPYKDRPVGISIAYRTDVLNSVYIPFGHASGNMDPNVVRDWGKRELRGKEIVMANAKYDTQILRTWGLDLEALNVLPADVAFPAALLDDNRRAGLDLNSMGIQYLGEGKASMSFNVNMQYVPSWHVTDYARQDSSLTLRLDEALQPFIKREGLNKVLDVENALIYVVCELERNGCRLDVETLSRWRKEVSAWYEQIMMSIYKDTGMLVSPKSSDSLIDLCKQLRIDPPVTLTAKGKPSFSEAELINLQHPIIDRVVKARRLDTLHSNFLAKYSDSVDDGGLLRSQFHQLKSDENGTVSGRFSSSGGGDPHGAYTFNAQQVMKKSDDKDIQARFPVRKLFIPDEGFDFFSCDAKQIEYRLFAHFANSPKIISAYKQDADTDFHALVMSMVQVLVPDIDRTHVKNVNFGRLYGAQEAKIASMLGVSIEEVRVFLSKYDRIFPEASGLMKTTKDTFPHCWGDVLAFRMEKGSTPRSTARYRVLRPIL
jgi:DNA polymerase I-like protein with 3'-5' exonuclease and polymerase domains